MKKFFKSLFWEIASVFLLVLLMVSAIHLYIFIKNTDMFFQETRQNLDSNIAEHIASNNDCFLGDSVNNDVLKNVFHNVMVINPSIEVYLLGTDGKILSYYAPNKIIKIDRVPLRPIKQFISNKNIGYITGIDPKNPEKQKTFSAAEVIDDGVLKGYIYIVLLSQEYENASNMVFGSYILKLGIRSMVITLFFALVVGLISIGIIVQSIRKTVKVIRRFKRGELDARIHLRSKTELSEFANSFNEMADTIVSNMEELRKKDQLRRDLAANVSHDLRTPLSIIRGYVETLQMKNGTLSQNDQKHFVKLILKSIDEVITMVNELFELSKLEAHEVKPDLEVFPLTELLQNIYQQNIIVAEKQNITLTLTCTEDPCRVKADIRMIGKVIQNLLDNAMRYTPAGGKIDIALSLTDKDDHEILISDTGCGIPPEHVGNIFNRYYRNQNEQTSGAGIGLSIVRKIIELHHFKISVHSKPKEGTVFKIILPALNVEMVK